MTIKRYTDGMPLKVGQWINSEGIIRMGFAGAPAQIVEVKPKSVVVLFDRDNGKTRVKMNRMIQFVCDTKEESQALLAASQKHAAVVNDAENELRARMAKTARETIDALMQAN